MNIYRFHVPYGVAVVCAKDEEEAKKIFISGDGTGELCAEDLGYTKDIIDDDEPYLIDTTISQIIAFHP